MERLEVFFSCCCSAASTCRIIRNLNSALDAGTTPSPGIARSARRQTFGEDVGHGCSQKPVHNIGV
jgi:hypothetical protein